MKDRRKCSGVGGCRCHFKYVNMQKNFTFHIIILFYPGLVGLGFLTYPGTFSIVAVVAVSTFIINNLSQVSNLRFQSLHLPYQAYGNYM